MPFRPTRTPAPRGRRLWNIALTVLVTLMAMAVITFNALRRPPSEHVLQPTDPGVITQVAGTPVR